MSDIFGQSFSAFEKLASAKMEALRASINSHSHSPSGTGAQILFSSLGGTTGAITGGMLAAGTITGSNIAAGSIYLNSLYIGGGVVAPATTIHLSTDGYAVYAP